MPQVLRSVNRTAYLAAFAAACVLFAPPSAWAEGMGGAPVLTATAGDGEVDLSWTEWAPPADDAYTSGTIQYAWRMKVEGDAEWLETTYISGTSTTVGDLDNGTTYVFQVQGQERSWFIFSWVLRVSPVSEEVTATPTASDDSDESDTSSSQDN